MAEIPYTHTEENRGCVGKYPWEQLQRVGDFFDVPKDVRSGVRNAAWYHGANTGRRMRTFGLANGSVRVMLVEIDDGAN